MIKKISFPVLALTSLLFSGCATDYAFRPLVPEAMRTIAVPTFRNESNLIEIGTIATRQVLRELEREGTFKIRSVGLAAVEVQGEIVSVQYDSAVYNRRSGLVGSGGFLGLTAKISVVDKRQGRVLVDNRVYTVQVPMAAMQDLNTAQRDAAGRLANNLAEQVVDDILNIKW